MVGILGILGLFLIAGGIGKTKKNGSPDFRSNSGSWFLVLLGLTAWVVAIILAW